MPPYFQPIVVPNLSDNNFLSILRRNSQVLSAGTFNGKLILGYTNAYDVVDIATDVLTATILVNQNVQKICANTTKCFMGAAGIGRQIKASADGITFTDVFAPTGDIVSGDCNDTEVAFISGAGTLNYSLDNGVNWATHAFGGTYNRPNCLEYLPVAGLWMLVNASGDYRIGATIPALIADAPSVTSFSCFAELGGFIYAGQFNNSTIGKSSDGGLNYTTMSMPWIVGNSTCTPNAFVLYDDTLYVINALGAIAKLVANSWVLVPAPQAISLSFAVALTNDLLLFTSSATGIYYSTLSEL